MGFDGAELRFIRKALDNADEIGLIVVANGASTNEMRLLERSEDGKKVGIDLGMAVALYGSALRAAKEENAENDAFDDASRVALALNGDAEILWNARRRRIQIDGLHALEDERRFVDLVLTKHFKSAASWSHRLWVMRKYNERVEGMEKVELLGKELAACERVARAYRRCYNAWCYRTEIVEMMGTEQVFIKELDNVRAWIRTNVSDFSAMAYCQRLVSLLGSSVSTVAHEIRFANFMAVTYPGHESLWLHSRNLVHSLVESCSKEDIEKVALAVSEFVVTSESHEANFVSDDTLSIASDLLEAVQSDAFEGPTDPAGILVNQVLVGLGSAFEAGCIREPMQQRCALGYVVYICRELLLKVNNRVSPKFSLWFQAVSFKMPSEASRSDPSWPLRRQKWENFAIHALIELSSISKS